MEKHIVKILETSQITHDVKRFKVKRPEKYSFKPGQATEVSINKQGWTDKGRPFTFTSLPGDAELEFIIKTYPAHQGVTNELLKLQTDDTLILHEVFGAIEYKGNGVFIAGGAGVTPFISIFRQLHSDHQIGGNMLIFANKSEKDIILKNEFETMLGHAFINILESENDRSYPQGRIDEEFLKGRINDFGVYFYVCGPPPMMDSVLSQLLNLSVKKEKIVTEEF